ncbi:hypothetical protein TNCV_3250371 [Trichonephila clavipes]|nr:hypothetical protein TNCV_3250371 [Trichonephila clavipes]
MAPLRIPRGQWVGFTELMDIFVKSEFDAFPGILEMTNTFPGVEITGKSETLAMKLQKRGCKERAVPLIGVWELEERSAT